MSAMQLSAAAGSYMSPHYQFYTPSIIHAVQVPDSEHNSNAASPEDPYTYQQQQQPK